MVRRKDRIQKIGLSVLLLSMYSIFTISSITESWTITLVLLVISLALLTFSTLTNSILVNSIHLVGFTFSLFCLFGVLRGAPIVFFVFYFIYFIILIVSNNIEYKNCMTLLQSFRLFGLIFSVGCYWQYFFSDQYYATLFPLFGSEYQRSIRRQFYFHSMCTGFTSQTVATAGFIILGIISAIYCFQQKKGDRSSTKPNYILFFVELVVLTGGLLLTGKRSPIINFACAFIVVDFLSSKRSKRMNHIFGSIMTAMAMVLILYLLAPLFSDSRNSITRLFEYASLADGGDITNGRMALYADAIKEFENNPILGIGWGNYRVIYESSGVHNIYLQLLCECGIVGFFIIVFSMGMALIKSVKQLKKSIRYNSASIITICKLSVFLQIYTWVYGVFGNPIYDQNYLLMYILGLMLSASVDRSLRNDVKLIPT